MTSCLGTSSTMVRRSTRDICWMIGITITRPGPFTPVNRPSVKTTPRSYSLRILIALTSSAMTKTPITISGICSIDIWLS